MKTKKAYLAGSSAVLLALASLAYLRADRDDAPAAKSAHADSVVKPNRPASRPAAVSSLPVDSAPDFKTATRREKPEATPSEKTEPPSAQTVVMGAGNLSPEILKKIADSQEKARQQKIDDRVDSLATKLGFSPAQKQKLLDALQKHNPEGKLIDALKSGDNNAILQALRSRDSEEKQIDEEILSLLETDEQKRAYEEMRQEQILNEVEVATYNDLGSLQSSIANLSQAQKDQAFEAFADINQTSKKNPEAYPNEIDLIKAKMEALEPILTPEQMKDYTSKPIVLSRTVGPHVETLGSEKAIHFEIQEN